MRTWLYKVDTRVSPFLYIAPFFVLFAVFGLYPLGYTAYVSLTDWTLLKDDHTYVGLANYVELFQDPYFWNALKRMLNKGVTNDPFSDTRVGLEEWNKHISSFGFGRPLGIDLTNEKGGLVPSVKYYDRSYGGRPWTFSNIYSIAIGECENLVVPLQMANFAATVANRG